jgi:hypothetical protein
VDISGWTDTLHVGLFVLRGSSGNPASAEFDQYTIIKPLVYDDFESYTDGSSIDGLNGWALDAGTTGVVQSVTALEGQALQIDGGSARVDSTGTGSESAVWLEMSLKF